MSDLFDIPETLSPRLAWMRKHGIMAQYHEPVGEDGYWEAWQNHRLEPEIGDSEEEALFNLAAKLSIKDWRQ